MLLRHKHLNLTDHQKRLLTIARSLMVLLFVFAILSLLASIVFPTKRFSYDFTSPNAQKNNITDIRLDTHTELNPSLLRPDDLLIFNTGTSRDYSHVDIIVKLDEADTALTGSNTVRRGHRSFFSDIGEPLKLKEGSLVSYKKDLYMYTDDTLRPFSSREDAQSYGWPAQAFIGLSREEFELYTAEQPIQFEFDQYPEGSLFLINNVYYRLQDGTLKPFVSDKAFETLYPEEWVLEKDDDIFNVYPPSKDQLGFANGTLASFGEGVYILSEGIAHPILNEHIFEAMGYDWNDVLEINSEEFSLYTKTGLFTLDDSHPEGTLFKTTENDTVYQYSNNELHQILGTATLPAQRKHSSVIVPKKTREETGNCQLSYSKTVFFSGWRCRLSLDPLSDPPRSDYEHRLAFDQPVSLAHVTVIYKQTRSVENFIGTLSAIKQQLFNRFLR